MTVDVHHCNQQISAWSTFCVCRLSPVRRFLWKPLLINQERGLDKPDFPWETLPEGHSFHKCVTAVLLAFCRLFVQDTDPDCRQYNILSIMYCYEVEISYCICIIVLYEK